MNKTKKDAWQRVTQLRMELAINKPSEEYLRALRSNLAELVKELSDELIARYSKSPNDT